MVVDGVDVDVLFLRDIGDRGLAVAQLLEELFGREVERLGGRRDLVAALAHERVPRLTARSSRTARSTRTSRAGRPEQIGRLDRSGHGKLGGSAGQERQPADLGCRAARSDNQSAEGIDRSKRHPATPRSKVFNSLE